MIAAKLAQLGLDQPMHIQLLRFFNSLLHGDLGVSSRYRAGAPIIDIISQKAPLSIELGVMAMGVAMLLGLPCCPRALFPLSTLHLPPYTACTYSAW